MFAFPDPVQKFFLAIAPVCCGLSLFVFNLASASDNTCADLPPAQQAVVSAWKQASLVVAADNAATNAPLLDLGKRTHVSLLAGAEIAALKTSRPREKGTVDHAGLMRFQVPTSGLYVVGSAAKVWIEVFADAAGDPLPTEDIDRTLRCTGIHKALSYRLDAGRIYILQISESVETKVDLLIHALGGPKAPTK